ncbi:DUF1738 domain-containing protein [Stutzerimonas stutzeri]|uniref:ArdC family protein n=1 Tax=Comamonas sp. TaxID=34028 RepID=UPI0012CC1309|nr:zincin-like metallopeptidase domain-containing protein [Comamonas sp.]MPS90331.1 DUF1738 domain-containing protein [Comamonas sp.]HBZ8879256.1 DUF1738 domain-containing protein [Klebsiella pneumoniae]
MAAREDFRQRLTNALIESIEENDGLPWERGWDNMATRPFNPGTGIKYKGGNVLNLLLEQIKRGSDDPRWMTLKQANDAGYSVRKGAKAAYVEYWDWGQPQASRKAEVDEQGKPLPRVEADEAAEEEQEQQRRKPRVFFATVFNGSDIVGLPEIKREIGWQPNELAEKLIAATGAEIEHTAVSRAGFGVVENAAYYTHGQDKIVVPPRESFKSEGDYYATVLHELAHWTGHHSRLARRAPDEKRPFGSPEYAQEELRAEIASMFLTSMVGVEGRIQNHAKYTGSWLEVLKGDKHEIFRAARDAEKIVDHIFEYAPELREVVEARMADNLLPKEPPKRKLDSGISKDLPNFIPPEAKAQVRTGRDDPRWAAFDQTVRGEARKFGVDEAVVDKALGLIEPQFTEVMNAAKKNGYTADDMNTMLARNIVDEMRTADVRQQQWERFCDQVRQAGADLYPVEQIELALQELGGRYQQLIAKSTQEGWTTQQTDTEIRSMIFGEEGRRPITGEYVKAFIESSPAAQQVAASADSDDDFVLTPLGLSDAMPEDSGAVSDEHIKGAERYIMDDAEIQDINTP